MCHVSLVQSVYETAHRVAGSGRLAARTQRAPRAPPKITAKKYGGTPCKNWRGALAVSLWGCMLIHRVLGPFFPGWGWGAIKNSRVREGARLERRRWNESVTVFYFFLVWQRGCWLESMPPPLFDSDLRMLCGGGTKLDSVWTITICFLRMKQRCFIFLFLRYVSKVGLYDSNFKKNCIFHIWLSFSFRQNFTQIMRIYNYF